MKYILLVLCSFFFFESNSQTVTWTGLEGNHLWDDKGNWDTSDVPCVTCDVIIGGDSVVYSINATINSLKLSSSSALNILNGAKLIVEQSSTVGVTLQNNTRIYNYGNLQINYSNNEGFVILTGGKFENQISGILEIFESGSSGLVLSRAEVNNFGEIVIEQSATLGVSLSALGLSSINNYGNFSISNTTSRGIWNYPNNIIKNLAGGILTIKNSNLDAILNQGELLNSGSIILKDLTGNAITSNGFLHNEALLEISNITTHGLVANKILNEGEINIKNVQGVSINSYGSSTDTLLNKGLLDIQDGLSAIQYSSSGKFTWIQVINATAFKRREANFLALGPKS
jgi:hypothetical protein